MCFGGPPSGSSVQPVAQRQPAKSPDASIVASRVADQARRRMGFAATILTPPGGLAPAATTGKTLLGG